MESVTIQEASYRLNLSQAEIRRYIREGRLQAHREGGSRGRSWLVELPEEGWLDDDKSRYHEMAQQMPVWWWPTEARTGQVHYVVDVGIEETVPGVPLRSGKREHLDGAHVHRGGLLPPMPANRPAAGSPPGPGGVTSILTRTPCTDLAAKKMVCGQLCWTIAGCHFPLAGIVLYNWFLTPRFFRPSR